MTLEPNRLDGTLAKAVESARALSVDDMAFLLSLSEPEDLARLYAAARGVKLKCGGRGVSVRGLVEAGNICAKDCFYCGIRKSNGATARYSLSADEIVSAAKAAGLPMCPGVATASELSQALSAGCRFVKFFPAEAAGGVKMIKNLLGAFRFTGVKFMPTGGINLSNLKDYLAVPEIVACGGTWIVPKDALASNDWDAIEKLAADAAALMKGR